MRASRPPLLLFPAVAAALSLTACYGGTTEAAPAAAAPAEDDAVAVVDPTTGPLPGDPEACDRYATDGQTFQDAYDAYDGGATEDPSQLYAALTALAGDVHALDENHVTPAVYASAQDVSSAAGEAVPALQGGDGIEQVDAVSGGLEILADVCAAVGG
jgi:hypothetical protein